MINVFKYPQSLESKSTVYVVYMYTLPCFGTFSASLFCFTYHVSFYFLTDCKRHLLIHLIWGTIKAMFCFPAAVKGGWFAFI